MKRKHVKYFWNCIRYPRYAKESRCECCGYPMSMGRPWMLDYNPKTKDYDLTPSYFYECNCNNNHCVEMNYPHHIDSFLSSAYTLLKNSRSAPKVLQDAFKRRLKQGAKRITRKSK